MDRASPLSASSLRSLWRTRPADFPRRHESGLGPRPSSRYASRELEEDELAKTPSDSRAFSRYTWGVLVYLLGVIVFGAWVRITHSGAGCGRHWPDCNGGFTPFSGDTEQLIEFTHRATSGLLGPLGLTLLIWAFIRYGRHRISWAAVVTFIWILFEAALGAGLVLGELVADDDSVARAVVIGLHLVNTLILTGACALTAWWSNGGQRDGGWTWKNAGALRPLLLLGLMAVIVTSMTGAVTALGDTLFPVDPTYGEGLFNRIREDVSSGSHFLVRLRVVHPIVAVSSALFLIYLSVAVRQADSDASAKRWSWVLFGVTTANVLLGVVNIALFAPGWLQLVHLFVAQAVWIAALIMSSATLMQFEAAS